MKLNTIMPARLQPYFEQELRAYRAALEKNQFSIAWRHLERAHIIGQAYPWEHSYVHWKMLFFGIRIKSTKEVIGQIPRLLVGGVKSFVGKIFGLFKLNIKNISALQTPSPFNFVI